MDTNRIKKFAVEARNILKRGIAAKITSLGFNAKGEVDERFKPQLMQGGSLWNGQLQTEGFYHQWMALYRRVLEKNLKEVYEEAAYTWFNRLMAIRILQKNGLCEPVMEYADAARTPRIVNEARMGNIPQMPEAQRQHLMELLDDDTKVTEQFALLVTVWCHQNPIIQACFGGIADYTELLLPQNILAEGGFVDMINHTEFISDEEYQSPELIGWLYQFYISERKDEVFAKKGKFEADEIPAATQIFTPNWIVKYMVQNTVGQIYIDNNPWTEDELKDKWKYLVEPDSTCHSEQREESIFRYDELTDLKVADLACGSGHILNECFDLLYGLYIAEGYSRNETITNIFTKNLTGVDLDTRAKQMAQFALLLKASQKDESFADAHCLPQVLNMPKPWDEEAEGDIRGFLHHFFQGQESTAQAEELAKCFRLMKDADSLGSIMKFDISPNTRLLLQQTVDYWRKETFVPELIASQLPAMQLILTLTESYSALVMNPPYMGSGKMNDVLSQYAKNNYPISKGDLFAMFIDRSMQMLQPNARAGLITMESWMFLSSYEDLRKHFLSSYYINSLGHFGWHIIGIAFGTAMTIFEKNKDNGRTGIYSYLTIDDVNKEQNVPYVYPKKDNGRYAVTSQQNFKKIPGSPIGYWVSDAMLSNFGSSVSYYANPCKGIDTGENEYFLKAWHEVSFKDIDATKGIGKYVPYNKGGGTRKWYGFREYVLKWYGSSEELESRLQWGSKKPTLRNRDYWFKESFTWSSISSGGFSARYSPKGAMFDNGGSSMFANEHLMLLGGYTNTNVAAKYFKILAPTINFQPGDVGNLPISNKLFSQEKSIIKNVTTNISISKSDWDAHETSWDFEQNELIALNNEDVYIEVMNDWADFHGVMADLAAPEIGNLEWLMQVYQTKWETKFMRLHQNEEELNRQFIDIYGLQDELTPDVPLNEITILQQGEIDILPAPGDTSGCCDTIKWNNDVVLKQLISYAVGVWMGRYRLDKKGLHIAHPEPTAEELAAYDYKGQTVYMDDDGIIPILPSGAPFDDNLCNRIADFVRIALGEENLTRNLNYIEQQLGMSIEQYCTKDFWKDHKKMYQNRPIYWLFSSKKGAFKCITYMHRMDAYTAERVRSKYLLPYIEWLQNKVNDLDSRAAQLSTTERRQLDSLRKTLEECQEYHDRLQVLAEDTARTAFDLDDGVVVNYTKYGDVLAKIK